MDRWTNTAARVLASTLLFAHYVQHVALGGDGTAGFLGSEGLWKPTLQHSDNLFVRVASVLTQASSAWLQVFFLACCASCVSLAFGVAPKLCACALVLASSATYFALFPAITVDDHFASALCLALALAVDGARPAAGRTRKSSGVLRASLVLFLLSQLASLGVASRGAVSPVAQLACFFAAAVAVAPLGRARALALLPATYGCLLLSRAPGLFMFSAALALAAWLLAVHGCTPSSTQESHTPPTPPPSQPLSPGRHGVLDLRVALALSLALLSCLHTTAAMLGATSIAGSSAAVLAHAGMPPLRELWSVQRAPLVLVARAGQSHETPVDVSAVPADRIQALLHVLEDRASSPAIREAVARAFVRTHCQTHDRIATGELTLLRAAAGAPDVDVEDADAGQRIAWFDCAGDQPALLLLDAADARADASPPTGARSPPVQHFGDSNGSGRHRYGEQ